MKRKASSFEAELEGVFQGLKLIHERRWKNAVVETDSMTVVTILTDSKAQDSTWVEVHPGRVLIKDCLGLMKLTAATIVHTLREGNRCADAMARAGGRQLLEHKQVKEPPDEVKKALAEDLRGTAFPRGFV